MATYYNLYSGNQPYNDTIHLNGPAPLDDRKVFSDLKGLYFTHGDKSHPLYNRAYKGMEVIVYEKTTNNNALLMVLNDPTPYLPDNTSVDVTADNYLNYWVNFSGSQYKLVKSATATSGMLSSYKLAYKSPIMSDFVTIDDCVIDIPKDYVLKDVHQCKASYDSATKKYTETSKPTDSSWATDKNSVYIHFIWHTSDNDTNTSETYLKVADVIKVDLTDINNNLKVLNTSVNTLETRSDQEDASINILKNRSDIEDVSINTITNYVHKIVDTSVSKIEAHLTKNDVSINTLENRSNVEDTSIKKLDTSVQYLDTSLVWLHQHVIDDERTVSASLNDVDSSITSIKNGNIYFKRGTANENTYMLSAHGNLAKNTTMKTLETMTISEILKSILFELATPKKTDATASLTWKSGSIYASYVDIGNNFPAASDFVQTYTNATAQWISAQDATVKGGNTTISKFDSSVLQFCTSTGFNTVINVNSSSYTPSSYKVKEGTNGYFRNYVNYVAGSDAVDSLGNTTNSSGTKYFAAIATTKTSSILTFNGGYRIFSNANKISSSDLWSSRNTNPGSFRGNTNITKSDFIIESISGKTFYLQWSENVTVSDAFYLYIPNKYSISSVGSADPTRTNAYNNLDSTYYSQEGTATVNNGYMDFTYKKYHLTRVGGICTLKITVA